MKESDITQSILDRIPDSEVFITGEGSNITVTVITDQFKDLSSVQRQQLVYTGINEFIQNGAVHAVKIQAHTVEEWKQKQKDIHG